MELWRWIGVAALVVPTVLLAAAGVGKRAWADGSAAEGGPAAGAANEVRVPVTLTGGYETDARDGGRPVALIAAALGVTPEQFREAFSGVTPARGGAPDGAQARRNKEALLRVLAPLGVSNERLDEVSDYYRYRPERGERWRHVPAKAHAVVREGKVTGFVVTEAGAGYSSPPRVAVEGMEGVAARVTLSFGRELKTNGGVGEIVVVAPAATPLGAK